jgi:hypothetical protein
VGFLSSRGFLNLYLYPISANMFLPYPRILAGPLSENMRE